MRDIKGTVTLETKEYNAILKDLEKLDAVTERVNALMEYVVIDRWGYTATVNGIDYILGDNTYYKDEVEKFAVKYGFTLKFVKDTLTKYVKEEAEKNKSN